MLRFPLQTDNGGYVENLSPGEIEATIEQVRAAMYEPTRVHQKGYWEHDVLSESSTDTQDQIFHAVGAALSTWESADSALATLYTVLCDVDGQSFGAISRTFGSIVSSSGRRKVIKAAAEMYFGADWQVSQIKKGLNDLLSAFSKASERRDEFAHGQAYGFTLNNVAHGCFLLASSYIASHNRAFPAANAADPFSSLTSTYRYTASEILSFAQKFGELRNAVYWYTGSIRRILGRPGIAFVLEIDKQKASAVKSATE
jgi:hypothetical protein